MRHLWSLRTTAVAVMLAVTAWPAAMGMTGLAAAAPTGVTKAADLYAGKTTDVGDIFVWNDTTKVYVEIDVASGWCMTESHVAVAASLTEIYQVNGNPVPGKFPQGDTYSPCGTTDTFSFLIADVGTNPYVAVHAKVWEIASLTTATIVSDTTADRVYGPVGAYLPPMNAGWGSSVVAVEPSFASAGVWPTISGATWISTEAIEATTPVPDTWRFHRAVISVPAGALPLAGSVAAVTSDNAERVWFNGGVLGTDGEVDVPYTDNQEWSTVLTYGFMPVVGNNTLDFVWRNYGACAVSNPYCTAPGLQLTPAQNPNGLIYKAWVKYYAHGESAWAGTLPFSGRNWATYFRYTASLEQVNLYDVTATPGAWDCALGVTNTSGADRGDVTWARAGNTVSVTIAVTGALPGATYDVWVEQNPGTCPPGTSTPSNDGALTTNASGNGTATFSFTPTGGAVNFWLTLWTPSGPPYPGAGAQVLRAPAVSF